MRFGLLVERRDGLWLELPLRRLPRRGGSRSGGMPEDDLLRGHLHLDLLTIPLDHLTGPQRLDILLGILTEGNQVVVQLWGDPTDDVDAVEAILLLDLVVSVDEAGRKLVLNLFP